MRWFFLGHFFLHPIIFICTPLGDEMTNLRLMRYILKIFYFFLLLHFFFFLIEKLCLLPLFIHLVVSNPLLEPSMLLGTNHLSHSLPCRPVLSSKRFGFEKKIICCCILLFWIHYFIIYFSVLYIYIYIL